MKNFHSILHLAVMHNKHDIVKNVLRVISTLPQCDVINQPNDLQYVSKSTSPTTYNM